MMINQPLNGTGQHRIKHRLWKLGVALWTFPLGLLAQPISITAPGNSQTITGTAFVFTSAISGMPNLCSVEYDVNSELAGISWQPPWSYTWNTNYVLNNEYNTVIAIARDCQNNVISTSVPVTRIKVDNPYPESFSNLNWTVSAPAAPWSGTVSVTVTFTGTKANQCRTTSNCYMAWFIDGKLLQSDMPITANAFNQYTVNFDTRKWDNQAHKVVMILKDASIMTSGSHAAAQWEQSIAFSNGRIAEELHANKSEVWLCTAAQANCPTSYALTAMMFNTDRSTTAASLNGCTSSNTAAAGVSFSSGTCTVAQVAYGDSTIRLQDVSGKIANVVVHVNVSNAGLAHFHSDGSISATWSPGTSMRYCSVFMSGQALQPDATGKFGGHYYPSAFNPGTDYRNSGCQVVETGVVDVADLTLGNQAAWEAGQQAVVNDTLAYVPAGLFIHPTDGGFMNGPDAAYRPMKIGSSYTTPAVTTIFSKWAATGRVVGLEMTDETNYFWNSLPTVGVINWSNPIWNGGAISISDGIASVPFSPAALDGMYGNFAFIVTGATTHSCLNSDPSMASLYNAANRIDNGKGAGSFSFTTSCANGTVNSTTDPGLIIQRYGWWWLNTNNGSRCTSGCNANGFLTGDMFTQFRTWATNAANSPKFTWPNGAGTNQDGISNWCGSAMSDYCTFYFQPQTQVDYLPQFVASAYLMDPVNGVVGQFRQKYSWLTPAARSAPILMETGGIANYGYQGYSVPVIALVDGAITFSQPHGIFNILLWSTRLWYNSTNLYVTDCPTLLTCHVALSAPNFSARPGGTATLHFASGGTLALDSYSVTSGDVFGFSISANSGCSTLNAHLGDTATVTGTGTTLDSVTIYILPISLHQPYSAPCTDIATGWYAAQIPLGKVSGGSATIVLDNGYKRGVNHVNQLSESSALQVFMNEALADVLPSVGTRFYSQFPNYQDDPTTRGATTIFQDTGSSSNNQTGINPRFGQYGLNQAMWDAHAKGQKISSRLAKWMFGALLAAPDLGPNLLCSARASGTYGNILMCLNGLLAPITRTIDLTPYLIPGQKIRQIDSDYTQIKETEVAASSSSVTVTFAPGELLAFVFPKDYISEFPVRSIAVHQPLTEDVANASTVAVRYAYTEFPFEYAQVGNQMLFQTYNCAVGFCTPFIDTAIGTIYYQILYLKADGSPLAISDMQTLE